MRSFRLAGPILGCLLATVASAQTISGSYPGSFVDISTTGGTAITGVTDDSAHVFTSTIGNAMFPAGTVNVGNNGLAIAGSNQTYLTFVNADVPLPTGVPSGLPLTSNGMLLPHWDDLYPAVQPSATTIYWQEQGGVLYIMWLNDNHFSEATAGAGVTFEIQVFGTPGSGPWVQYLYNDTTFTGSIYGTTNDNGASATIGYIQGTGGIGNNLRWSFNTPGSISPSTVISLFPAMQLVPSSPLGSGSLRFDMISGPPSGIYFMAVTLSAGAFPAGWFYGLDIPFTELGIELSSGYPFLGTFDPAGSFTIGPFSGLPSGLPFYAVALGVPAGSSFPTIHSSALTYTIP